MATFAVFNNELDIKLFFPDCNFELRRYKHCLTHLDVKNIQEAKLITEEILAIAHSKPLLLQIYGKLFPLLTSVDFSLNDLLLLLQENDSRAITVYKKVSMRAC